MESPSVSEKSKKHKNHNQKGEDRDISKKPNKNKDHSEEKKRKHSKLWLLKFCGNKTEAELLNFITKMENKEKHDLSYYCKLMIGYIEQSMAGIPRLFGLSGHLTISYRDETFFLVQAGQKVQSPYIFL